MRLISAEMGFLFSNPRNMQIYPSSHRQYWTKTVLQPALVKFIARRKGAECMHSVSSLSPKREERKYYAHFFFPNSAIK